VLDHPLTQKNLKCGRDNGYASILSMCDDGGDNSDDNNNSYSGSGTHNTTLSIMSCDYDAITWP